MCTAYHIYGYELGAPPAAICLARFSGRYANARTFEIGSTTMSLTMQEADQPEDERREDDREAA
ncbi:MAG TPA: hypothetical protein VFR24_20255 [Candidatus Angelobacter sp.]|nr:hypothetical protein [Candidatus Angelobacter sp.]